MAVHSWHTHYPVTVLEVVGVGNRQTIAFGRYALSREFRSHQEFNLALEAS